MPLVLVMSGVGAMRAFSLLPLGGVDAFCYYILAHLTANKLFIEYLQVKIVNDCVMCGQKLLLACIVKGRQVKHCA